MGLDVNTVFQIAGLGIIVAMLHTVLKMIGKEDYAHWVTLLGFVVALFMVISLLDDLFQKVKDVFLFHS
ncbi:stage III sporulation protein AC [Fictibacillus barbaricus]|jgi:stage III sporulation protein AC|uniref:Stage III sporulation protein AC n=1 Tax=Fictibacillus barbaricus TaxID=182136 RepID=A0ABU1TZV6_9BACL|nr:stage III sporulation protein AC [Fictibacillus barbaricus]MDR7072691.1 stage III sporulation protein AC [Fictibacillus barbaricus]